VEKNTAKPNHSGVRHCKNRIDQFGEKHTGKINN